MGTPVCRFSRFMSGTGSLKVGWQLWDEIKEAVHGWLRSQSEEFLSRGIQALVKHWHTCIERGWDYVEKWRSVFNPICTYSISKKNIKAIFWLFLVQAGVLQGSILVPTPYSLYINDLPTVKSLGVHVALFADYMFLYATSQRRLCSLKASIRPHFDWIVLWALKHKTRWR
jgi:hypothetical protein